MNRFRSSLRSAVVVCALAIGAHLAWSTPAAAQETPAPVQLDIHTFLKSGRFKAQEYQPYSPPRFKELGNRFKAAMEKDPDFSQEQLAKSQSGEALPYDPRMGLTEAEYQEFLKLQAAITMKPVRTVTIVVEPNLGGWRFGAATTASALRGFAVDTLRDQVHTPFGDLNPGPQVNASKQGLVGVWKGLRWRGDFIDPQTPTGTIVVFAVGKQADDGRTVLYVEKRRIEHGLVADVSKSFFRYLTAGKTVPAKTTKKAGAKKAAARKAG